MGKDKDNGGLVSMGYATTQKNSKPKRQLTGKFAVANMHNAFDTSLPDKERILNLEKLLACSMEIELQDNRELRAILKADRHAFEILSDHHTCLRVAATKLEWKSPAEIKTEHGGHMAGGFTLLRFAALPRIEVEIKDTKLNTDGMQ